MAFIDAHTHTFLRGPEDLAAMARAGVESAVVCAFLPVPASGACSLIDLFFWLDDVERKRLVQAGIRPIIAVGVHPRALPPETELDRVLAEMNSLVTSGRASAIGEIGLETGSEAEKSLLLRQLRLARDLHATAIVHTPRADKRERLRETLRLVDEAGIAPGRVILDHLTPDLVAELDARSRHFWMGLTVQPGKTTPEQLADLVMARGTRRLIVNSDLSHMPSWPDALAKTAQRLGELGLKPEDIERLTRSNAEEAFELPDARPVTAKHTSSVT